MDFGLSDEQKLVEQTLRRHLAESVPTTRVREISSRVVVLHQGRIVLDGTVAQVVESELVRTIYSGGGTMSGAHT